jgi:hypothetical protein
MAGLGDDSSDRSEGRDEADRLECGTCAWCGAALGTVRSSRSHGICGTCYRKVTGDSRYRSGEGGLPEIAFAVDEAGGLLGRSGSGRADFRCEPLFVRFPFLVQSFEEFVSDSLLALQVPIPGARVLFAKTRWGWVQVVVTRCPQ